MSGLPSRSRDQDQKERSKRGWEAIGNDIMVKLFRRAEDDGRYAFITRHDLEGIWTDERLTDIFAGAEFPTGESCLKYKDSHLKIMSILVMMRWKKWPSFKAIFVDRPGRTDADLPLTGQAFTGTHFSEIQKQCFISFQCKVLPATIQEHRDVDYASSYQMPFGKTPERVSKKGSYCSIEKIIIVSRQYKDRQGESNLHVSPMKSIIMLDHGIEITVCSIKSLSESCVTLMIQSSIWKKRKTSFQDYAIVYLTTQG